MDNARLLLFLALFAILFLIYSAWQTDYGRQSQRPVATTTDQRFPASDAETPADLPQVRTTLESVPTHQVESTPDDAPATTSIRVETDVLRLEISPRGGTITSAWLRDYSVTAENPDEEFRLFKPIPPNMFIAQAGLLSDAPDKLPTHEANFQAAASEFILGPNQDHLEIELIWQGEDGLEVVKRYRLERGSYVIHSTQTLRNGTDSPVIARSYRQLQRTELHDPNESSFIYTFTGGVYFSPEDKYKKVSFEDMRKQRLDRAVADGWIAMMQHYFLASWIPPTGELHTFYTNVLGDARYIIGAYSQPVSIGPGAEHQFESRLFVGPKLQHTLSRIAPGLELAVDYGWLTIIAQPIFWVLSWIYKVVGNWGWAIIVLTILIKLAFYKLSEASYKSMAKMRQVAPRMQALKDRYGDDKARLNQAMMDMYKTEKINPLGGCLPVLIQIPVFIALYWVLLESVEMRHAPFVLWLNNLSAPDPYFVLPLIMGVSMFVQMKLNPPAPDPIQQKIMMALPFVFTVFFAFFPSGLVLYWTVNNLLSIAQQWHITRTMEKAAAKNPAKSTVKLKK